MIGRSAAAAATIAGVVMGFISLVVNWLFFLLHVINVLATSLFIASRFVSNQVASRFRVMGRLEEGEQGGGIVDA
jgi:hypothetical protein